MTAPTSSAVQELAGRIRAAISRRERLHIRGGGSKGFLSAATPQDVPALETRALHGVLSYEPSELVVQVRAGTPLGEVEALLHAHGQCLPFEPPHFGAPGQATVGGMVAAGLAGPARVSAGAVRDFVLGVEMLNGRGECLRFGGQVMKNVAGYDIPRLMCGSRGALGVLTEVSLKVLPLPAREASLRFACTRAQALDWLNRWAGQPLPLNASLWIAPGAGAGTQEGELIVRLRGARAAVRAACQTLGGEDMPPEEAATLWHACREQQLPWFAGGLNAGQALWRLVLPPTTAPLALPEGCTGPLLEWHGGLRWILVDGAAAETPGPQLHRLAQDSGGFASLFRTAGPERPPPVPRPNAALQQRIRQAFDPDGVFWSPLH